MNKREREMVALLVRGREEYGWVAVKAEFEAEGTRLDELLRLVEIAHRAQVKLAVKIGGCEALMDLFEAKQIGADYIVAPMIETAYALTKYDLALSKAYSEDDQVDTQFLWNIETVTGFNNRVEMADFAAKSGALKGIVFGRSDYSGSLGMSGDQVNDDRITEDIIKIAEICEDKGLDLVVGGGVSRDSVDALKRVSQVKLTRFETRKVIMSAQALSNSKLEDGLLDALRFELMWLTNKREYYSAIFGEDEKRFQTLRSRWNVTE
jgi:hypothetical protein